MKFSGIRRVDDARSRQRLPRARVDYPGCAAAAGCSLIFILGLIAQDFYKIDTADGRHSTTLFSGFLACVFILGPLFSCVPCWFLARKFKDEDHFLAWAGFLGSATASGIAAFLKTSQMLRAFGFVLPFGLELGLEKIQQLTTLFIIVQCYVTILAFSFLTWALLRNSKLRPWLAWFGGLQVILSMINIFSIAMPTTDVAWLTEIIFPGSTLLIIFAKMIWFLDPYKNSRLDAPIRSSTVSTGF